jgi:hypothetical protein
MGLESLAKHQKLIWAKEIALPAAASSWAGISSIRDRDKSILATADKFVEWLLEEGREE